MQKSESFLFKKGKSVDSLWGVGLNCNWFLKLVCWKWLEKLWFKRLSQNIEICRTFIKQCLPLVVSPVITVMHIKLRSLTWKRGIGPDLFFFFKKRKKESKQVTGSIYCWCEAFTVKELKRTHPHSKDSSEKNKRKQSFSDLFNFNIAYIQSI